MDFPFGALILPEPQREAAWRKWRAQQDIDTLSDESVRTLPLLAACLPRWLDGDADALRIQGMIKMAWSRNQIRLNRSVELRRVLLQSSVKPVVAIGPLAWSLLVREEGSIRAIPDLTLLIPRRHLFTSVSTLDRHGWKLDRSQPDRDTLKWSSNLAFAKGEDTLHLHWRLFPASAMKATGFERAFLKQLRSIKWIGNEFQVLSPEADLLHRFMDRPHWDPVPWQADVLTMNFAKVDWPRLCELANRYTSYFEPVNVLGRLMDLRREWQLPIPELSAATNRSFGSGSTKAKSEGQRTAMLRGTLGRLRSLIWRA